MSAKLQVKSGSLSQGFKPARPTVHQIPKIDYEMKSKPGQSNLTQKSQEPNNFESNLFFQQMAQFMSIYPAYIQDVDYSKELFKMTLTCGALLSELVDIISDKEEIQMRINQIEEFIKEKNNLSNEQLKKKNRRTAQEIEKAFICPYENCQKGYGSDVSLNLHIKIKHNGGSKTQRETIARAIFLAKLNKEEPPKIDIKFPPGYLENFQKNYEEPNWKSTNSSNSKQKDDESTQSETIHSPKFTLAKN